MTKNAVRIFLDSNVILSGLLSDKGAPKIILDILSLKLSFLTVKRGTSYSVPVKYKVKK